MYIFISGIKPIDQHTDTLTKHKKEKKEIILTTNSTHAMMFTTLLVEFRLELNPDECKGGCNCKDECAAAMRPFANYSGLLMLQLLSCRITNRYISPKILCKLHFCFV